MPAACSAAYPSSGNPKPFTSSGLARVFGGEEAADYFGVRAGDSRVPDVPGISQVGTVYTGGKKKIAEHGGANPGDQDVPLVVAGAVGQRGVRDQLVEMTLQAARIEHTPALPVS